MSGLVFFDYKMQLHTKGDREVTFQVARQATASGVQYSAWLSDEGRYIFMKRDLSDTTDISNKYFTSTVATEAFVTAWADRTNKTYAEYNEMFDNIT